MASPTDSLAIGERDQRRAFAIFRLTMGINFLLHGVTRIISGVTGFADQVSANFTETPLPMPMVWWFLAVLPFIEAVIGFLMIVGLKTRWALLGGGLLMAVLVFGTAIRSDWNALGTQMIYVFCYYFLISHSQRDSYGVDVWWNRRAAAASG